MKKSAFLFLLVFLFSMFNSCEEDEKNLLLGKWGFVSVKYIEYEDGVKVDEETSYEADVVYLEFLKGGVGHVYFSEVEYDTFSWTKDGKTVTIESDEEFEIETLTKSTLVLKITETWEEGGTTYIDEMIYTFTKVD